MSLKPWTRVDEGGKKTVVGWRTIVHKQFLMNNGGTIHADINDGDGSKAAVVIAITPGNEVVIARQYRCGPEKVLDDLPGGMVDPNESPEATAHRELMEETGYSAESMEFIGTAWIDAWSNAEHHYFIARGCVRTGKSTPDTFEDIEVDTIAIPELIRNALSANMTDVQAVLLAYDRLKKLEANT